MPVLMPTKSTVYTYLHQRLYLELPRDISFLHKLIFNIKSYFVRNLKNNTNFWIVQTKSMNDLLCKKFLIKKDKVIELPFYNINYNNNYNNLVRGNNFLYISNATNHKNHLRLIKAFKSFYNEYHFGELWLTIYDNQKLIEMIENEIKNGLPIVNLGYLNSKTINIIYLQCKFVIFPSLSESFGLGLIEGMEYGCDIIASDLPYTHEICEPSIKFDPFNINSIKDAFKIAMKGKYKKTIPLVSNKIDKLVNLLKND